MESTYKGSACRNAMIETDRIEAATQALKALEEDADGPGALNLTDIAAEVARDRDEVLGSVTSTPWSSMQQAPRHAKSRPQRAMMFC